MELKRDYLIDFLRSAAIILMVFAHTSMLLGLQSNTLSRFFQTLGNTACFTIFLFCFGASISYSYLKNGKKPLSKGLKRALNIYFAYLVICLLDLIESKTLGLTSFLRLAAFIHLPAYAEFLVAFIIFQILFTLKPKFFLFLSKNLSTTIISSLLIFTLGNVLSSTNLFILKPLTLLLWSRRDGFSFPVLQYFPFFIFGIYYTTQFSKRNLRFTYILSPLVLLFGLYITLFNTQIFNFLKNVDRWPPNPKFVILNLLILLTFILIFNLIKSLTKEYLFGQKFLKVIHSLSQHSLHILYWHIILLYGLRWTKTPISYIINYIVTTSVFIVFYLSLYAKKNIKKKYSKN